VAALAVFAVARPDLRVAAAPAREAATASGRSAGSLRPWLLL
jgi:hypothetical protein